MVGTHTEFGFCAGPDSSPTVEAATRHWSPRIQWIAQQRFRGAYNYSFEIPWFAEAKEAGVNAVITRLEIPNSPQQAEELRNSGGDNFWMIRDLDKVKATGKAAKQHGLHLLVMVNMGATRVTIDDGFRNNPRRYNNGTDFSPIDDIYWKRVIENRLLWLADTLDDNSCQLDGFMIDPEMYGAGARHGPDIDYGDFAMRQFTEAIDIKLDFESLSIAERARSIDYKQLTDRFRQFQFERLRSLSQQTRERLQAKIPDAIMGFFVWRNTLWYQAVAAGFSTPEVPCVVATESTYPGTFDDLFLSYTQQVRDQAEVPILFIPGVATFGGNSTEYLTAIAANSYHRAIHTEGYWIYAFGLFGDTADQRRPYLQAFTKTNRELEQWTMARQQGRAYQSILEPTPVPLDIPVELYSRIVDVRRWRPLTPDELPADPPAATPLVLRGKQTFFIQAKRGQKLSMDIRTVKLGSYTAPTICRFFRPDMTSMDTPQIPPGEQRQVEVIADVDGFWACVVGSLNNAFEVTPLSTTAAIWPTQEDGVWACSSNQTKLPRRFFFVVPDRVENFTVNFFAEPTEPATFRLFHPDGQLLKEHIRLTELATDDVRVDPDMKARVWWIETDNAVEDHTFSVIVPGGRYVVAARPEQLLIPD